MGNSRSQPCRRTRPMYLFYLIQRTWTGKTEPADNEDRRETADRESEFSTSSRCCSDCKSSHYRQDSLTFDSESEMAPNAEEELLAVKPWGPQPEKERLRPPTYNAEDYAIALRRWGRRPVVTPHESHGTLPSTTSSSSGYASGCGEMTLRQFTSVSELLNKLRADLRLAFPSFVQEFASPPADGITLLLETLRGVQLIQSSPPSGQGGPRVGTRRAALDELGCVECLAACGERCPDAPRLLSQAQPGLLALAVCLTSSLNRSRVLALQLLTKVCQAPGGHLAVSEAVSTLRLRYGEGGRFRFLAGALLAPRAAIALRVAGVSFLNAFLKSASRTQTRLYIQAEACEAGLEPRILQSWLTEVDVRSEDALTDLLNKEVQKWSHNCVDVEALQKRLARAEETCTILGNKVSVLQEQLDKFNTEKIINSYNGNNGNNNSDNNDVRRVKSESINSKIRVNQNTALQGMSSNAEDEGISSSERSSSPEELEITIRQVDGNNKIASIDNDQETTIDDVIEELRIIVKDAEEEEDRRGKYFKTSNSEKFSSSSRISVKSSNHGSPNDEEIRKNPITYFGRKDDDDDDDDEMSIDSAITRKLSSTTCRERITKTTNEGSLKIIVKSHPEQEDAIVPAILYPQPPRRAPPCLSSILATREQTDFLDRVVYDPREAEEDEDEEDIEEETLGDGSDSLLSASRLKYPGKNDGKDPTNLPSDLKPPNFYETQKTSPRLRNPRNNDVNNSPRESSDTTNVRNLGDSNQPTKFLQIYSEFETSGRTKEVSSVQRRGSCRYDSETDARKMPNRSVSQDALCLDRSSPDSGKSSGRIEARVRKFESLSALENKTLQVTSRGSRDVSRLGCDKISRFPGGTGRIRRSESFHHVSLAQRASDSSLTRPGGGGSDSGLVYVTDYDLEPLVARKTNHEVPPKSRSLLTKSLDRIDESLDSSPAFFTPKRCQTSQTNKEKRGKSSKPRNDEKSSPKSKLGLIKCSGRKSCADKSLKSDELYGGLRPNSKLLRNDQLYEAAMKKPGRWNFQNEVDGFRKINHNPDHFDPVTIASSRGHERSVGKFTNNEVFLPSGRYDAFGLGKNRFNAGKYSGQPATGRDNGIVGVRRNSAASLVAKRGKVTDILSGLY